MLPALWLEGLAALRSDQGDGGAVAGGLDDAADFCDGKARDFCGDASAGRSGEEELIVFSTMEGLGQGCAGMERQLRHIDFRRDA